MQRQDLERMTREQLIAQAERLGIPRPRVLTQPELIDEIIGRTAKSERERAKARGWLGRARDLLTRVVERGLHLPEAARMLRKDGNDKGWPVPPPPLPTVTLAEIYAAQGHLERAIAVLDEVIAREPDHREARTMRERFNEQAHRSRSRVVRDREPPPDASTPGSAEQSEQEEAPPAEQKAAPSTQVATPEPDVASEPGATASEPPQADAEERESVPAPQEVAPEKQVAPETQEAAPETQEAAPEAHEPAPSKQAPPFEKPEVAASEAPHEHAVATPTAPVELPPVAPPPVEPAPVPPLPIQPPAIAAPPTPAAPATPAALPAPAAIATPLPAPLEEPPLPERYQVDEIVAIAVDPRTIYLYWEVRPTTLARVRAEHPDGWLCVRIAIVIASWEGPLVDTRDLRVDALYGDRFLRDVQPGSNVRVSVGWRTDDIGEFEPIAVGSEVTAPRAVPVETVALEVARWEPEPTAAAPSQGRHIEVTTIASPQHEAPAAPATVPEISDPPVTFTPADVAEVAEAAPATAVPSEPQPTPAVSHPAPAPPEERAPAPAAALTPPVFIERAPVGSRGHAGPVDTGVALWGPPLLDADATAEEEHEGESSVEPLPGWSEPGGSSELGRARPLTRWARPVRRLRSTGPAGGRPGVAGAPAAPGQRAEAAPFGGASELSGGEPGFGGASELSY